ncbi:MAG: response regulator transcription factor [Alloprevotella sp.]
MKLLIVEDEKRLSDSIVTYLEEDDCLCEQAFTRAEANLKVGCYEYDIVLLDLMLPDGSGLDVLRKIKNVAPRTGVIIVSAKDSTDDKVEGLRLGADDYLAKPFHLSELGMRIFALMRRKDFTGNNLVRAGRLSIDLLGKHVAVEGIPLALTKTEYELLLFLFRNSQRVVSKSSLAEHLSGDMADLLDDFNFVYAHIKNLKAKLAKAGLKDCIKTVYGMGYKWSAEEL